MATISSIVGSQVYLGSAKFKVINSSGLLLCMENIGNSKFNSSSSSYNDFENSTAYNYLNNTFKDTLTTAEKGALKKTLVSMNGFEHAGQENNEGYFFLPGCYDFFTTSEIDAAAENASSYCTCSVSSKAGLSSDKSATYTYWLRDVYRTVGKTNSGEVWYVSSGSFKHGSMTSSYGLRPICWVTPSTTVIADGSYYRIVTITKLSTPSIWSSSSSVKVNTSYTISWSTITGATSYKVYKNGSLWKTTSATSASDTLSSSSSCASYYVIATSSSSLYTDSSASSTITVTKADSPPTTPGTPSVTLTANNATSTICAVSWSASSDADGDTVLYTLQYCLDGGNWMTAISSTLSTSTTKTLNTSGCSRISFRVKATANGVSSSYSSTTTKTIPVYNTAPTQPGTPNVTITNVTSTKNTCTVSWTASTDSNNDTIYYSLYYSLYNGSSWTSDTYLSKNTTTSRSINVSTSGYTKVRFKVYATDNIADAVASSYGQATLKHYPTITSSTSSNLGTFTTNSTIPSITYTVSDTDTETVTVKEYLNGTLVTTRSPYLSNSSITYTYTFSSSNWIKLPNGTYTVKLEVTDSNEVPQSITRTFTKKVTTIDFIAVVRSSISTCPTKIRINLNKKQLGGNILTCKVCNNGNDEVPNWEDCTPHVLMHKNYYFKNQLKTADTYCIKLRITLDKGTALSTTISAISGLKGRWI